MPPTTSPRSVTVRDRVLSHTRRRPSAVRRLVIASGGLALLAIVREVAGFGGMAWSSTVLGAVVVATFGALAVAGATALADVQGSASPEDETS